MICLVSFLHFAATGKALECENCQKRDNCTEKAEETEGRTMSDYISRQYLLDEYDRQHKGPPGGARKIVEEAPAEDVVPVIRCRDCKNRDEEDSFCTGRGWPCQLVPDNGFCDKGRKK